MLASLSGGVFMWFGFRDKVQQMLKYFVTGAMGVFVVTLSLMLQHSLHDNESALMVAGYVVLGAILLEIVQRLVPGEHHHHGSDEKECCEHDCAHGHKVLHKINPMRVLFSDAAHNVGDGILIATTFFVSPHAGISATIGVVLHEVVQEISEFFILKDAGYSTKRALVSNFIVSSTILVGAVLAIFVATATSYSYILIALSAGATFYIILRDLLPHTIGRVRHDGNLYKHIFAFIIGTVVMFAVVHVLPNSH
jgi:zinc and cadmium transporter